jgi:hypothetical protein
MSKWDIDEPPPNFLTDYLLKRRIEKMDIKKIKSIVVWSKYITFNGRASLRKTEKNMEWLKKFILKNKSVYRYCRGI